MEQTFKNHSEIKLLSFVSLKWYPTLIIYSFKDRINIFISDSKKTDNSAMKSELQLNIPSHHGNTTLW